ncbi:MAG: hypothetical protein ACKODJ_01010 [Bacteroidota bacterium]
MLTNSLKKISWLEYSDFLMRGKMFSVWTDILPFLVVVWVMG